MVQRVYLVGGTSPRLITSKDGYDATPSLADRFKTFDSNWFNGGGVKFQYFGDCGANFTFTYPYALSFVPKFAVQYHSIWNNNNQLFFYQHTGQPGYSVNPPSNAVVLFWTGSFNATSVAAARAYTNRIVLNNTYWNSGTYSMRASILVFEA